MDEEEFIRITLRLPRGLHGQLSSDAATSAKSLNAEIVGRLQEGVASDERANKFRSVLDHRELELDHARKRLDETIRELEAERRSGGKARAELHAFEARLEREIGRNSKFDELAQMHHDALAQLEVTRRAKASLEREMDQMRFRFEQLSKSSDTELLAAQRSSERNAFLMLSLLASEFLSVAEALPDDVRKSLRMESTVAFARGVLEGDATSVTKGIQMMGLSGKGLEQTVQRISDVAEQDIDKPMS